MRLHKNDDGVSEVIGAMLILLIMVVSLGTVQVYEVPRWNKELELQQFERAYSDFIDLRSNFEDVSIKNIPKTSRMHMGIRYPERFMLRNPGPGAYGSITTYPLNITISYSSKGTIMYQNFTSFGIVYEMNGISEFPKLVYEHGIIIRDFGNWSYTEDVNRLTTNSSIYIPVLMGIEPFSSIGLETLNVFPIPHEYYSAPVFSWMNVEMETLHPEIWANLSNESRPSGSKFKVDVENRTVKITDISGFNVRWLILPDVARLSGSNTYMGTITFADTLSGMGGMACTPPGLSVSNRNQGCSDLPKSTSVSKFILQDIAVVDDADNAELRFEVKDVLENKWEMKIMFDSDSEGNLVEVKIQQMKPTGIECDAWYDERKYQIDLTSCYRDAGINFPNVLVVKKMDSDILHVNIISN